MKKCDYCGTEFDGYYCPACGAPAEERQPEGSPAPQTATDAYKPPKAPAETGAVSTWEYAKWLALCLYLPIFGIIYTAVFAPKQSIRNLGKAIAVVYFGTIVIWSIFVLGLFDGINWLLR